MQAAKRTVAAGDQPVGIDHFAKSYDTLAPTLRSGKLRRNFQGYTDDNCEVTIGFGSSSISCFPGGYIQNEVATGRYSAAISGGVFAHSKGFELSKDEIVRAWIIEPLMCDFAFDKVDLISKFGAGADSYWNEAVAIAAEDRVELCSHDTNPFTTKPNVKPLVRIIAVKFDLVQPQQVSTFKCHVRINRQSLFPLVRVASANQEFPWFYY